LNDERLCSTDGNVADNKLSSNGYATSYLGKRLLGYGVISSRLELIAHERITPCPEIQHRVIATRISLTRCLRNSQQNTRETGLPPFGVRSGHAFAVMTNGKAATYLKNF
jgi:hypothetical protein